MKHNFRELQIWLESFKLVTEIYRMVKSIPDEEKYGLISQIRRSSVSVPSNIAEGSGRTSNKEFLHFLNIALSSSYELETQLLLLNELYSIDTHLLVDRLNNIQRMIGGFKRTIEKQN